MLIQSRSFAAQAVSTNWPASPEQAATRAISDMGLRQKGWRGFDQLPWVKDVAERYPQAIELAHTCSSHRPEYKDQATDLFYSTPQEDRALLRDYFAGKLGLEELSCQRSGAAAGLCDKRAAFREIYKIGYEACQPQQRAGMYL